VPADDLRQRREAVVREHMASENRHDFDAAIATFSHPRYELMATGQVYDGEDEVRRYFATTRAVFPDQRNELVSLRSTDDGVLVELDLLGTHANGRAFRSRMAALFLFEEGGHGIVCERVYFDQASILRQVGLA
jgi:predicted SnoaL-like aldol condensation-catalyzing enzyme